MHRAFQTAISLHKPNIVIFLGMIAVRFTLLCLLFMKTSEIPLRI